MDEGDPPEGANNEANHGAGPQDNPASTYPERGNEAKEMNTNIPKSMADMVRTKSNNDGPQVFLRENIQNIGFASTSNGVPSIYFSGAEINKLATSLGHAIVDLVDYARLLSGPKGTPVWFIDRHPMRVFKWSPDFDAYCESPIAAVWCNLIGLPIHLFDQSALYAIGKLLGTPIQVDRATANKSRLSFARICIEIDITQPPPDEIILDICGRTVVQQVKWDKIPPYCMECKHVGHKSDVCYAAGKTVRPPKRNYNIVPPKQPQSGGHRDKKANEEPRQNDSNKEWKQQGKNKTKESNSRSSSRALEHKDPIWSGPDFMGDMHDVGGTDLVIFSDEVDQNGRPRSKQDRGSFARSSSFGGGRGFGDWIKPSRHVKPSTSGVLEQPKGAFLYFDLERAEQQEATNHMSTNRYFSLMAREDFEENEEMADWEKDDPPNGVEDGDNPMITEAETCNAENGLQSTEFQGGPSNPPGTDLSC